MIYFLALIPATAMTVAGYVVLFLSNRSEGAYRTFGKYLGFWAFALAALIVLGAIFAAAHGGRHCGMMGERGMYGRMHGSWPGDRSEAAPQAPAAAPNPAAPPPSPHE
jgi:hypothetical protein